MKLGPQQSLAEKLKNLFIENTKKANITNLDLISFSMQQNGVTLSLIDQIKVLHEAIVLPDVFALSVLGNPMICSAIRTVAHFSLKNTNPKAEVEIIPLFGEELTQAIKENRIADANLILSLTHRFIDQDIVVWAKTHLEQTKSFTPGYEQQKNQDRSHSQESIVQREKQHQFTLKH